MTNDPREALEPCPFCGGNNVILSHKWDYGFIRRYSYCNGCGARGPSFNGEEEARAWWNTRALTASPGEQEPVAWQHQLFCETGDCIRTQYTATKAHPFGLPDKDFSAEFKIVSTPLYLSPPPAAGWDEAVEAIKFSLLIEDHYELREFLCGWLHGDTKEWPEFKSLRRETPSNAGWDSAINWLEGIAHNDGNADQSAAQRCVAILRAGQDFRREAPAPEGVAAPQLDPRWRTELDEIIGHLGAAVIQSCDKDDQIIMNHVRAAHEIAKVVRRQA